MKTKLFILWVATFFIAVMVRAQDTNREAEMINILKNLKYQQGTINLRDGLATLNVPNDFNYLGPDDAENVLVKLWGNPPSAQKPLGLLIPAGMTPASSNAWVVTIEYSEDGYVKDTDASTINYDKELKQMQQAISDNNKARQDQGYQPITLVGWAEPPHYDAATHKLYWAKDLKFGDDTEDTLNYCIRILGRRGVLELDAVSALGQLDQINQQTPEILGMVDFKEGNRYADFDPKVDKVAKYGIAALVAGGVLGAAAKFGLLKVLWVGILAAKKFVIIGVVAVIAFIKKLFKGRNSGGATPGT
ncbi:MAG TPA: DUF2167 domain-containing protein [Verrucomicrobiae bacterium]|jgi:uncharacterized membrane-anchored protein